MAIGSVSKEQQAQVLKQAAMCVMSVRMVKVIFTLINSFEKELFPTHARSLLFADSGNATFVTSFAAGMRPFVSK